VVRVLAFALVLTRSAATRSSERIWLEAADPTDERVERVAARRAQLRLVGVEQHVGVEHDLLVDRGVLRNGD